MIDRLLILIYDARRIIKPLLFFVFVLFGYQVAAQNSLSSQGTIEVGIARIDITPEEPIRLAGYGARPKSEAVEIIHRLEAKALAFGTDDQGPSILITVDLVGIPKHITAKLAEQLSQKIGLDSAQLVICASHTHGGPEVGNLLNILQYRGETFSDSLLALDQLVHIAQYTERLSQKLEEVAIQALADRSPSLVSWGQGEVGFARNRRTQGGPVDTSFPLMRIADTKGKLRGVLINYACHGTTLEGNVNKIHGDWMSEAQLLIESNHPGTVAMVSIGCGADANPFPRGELQHMKIQAEEISAEVDRLLASPLQPLNSPPVGQMKWVKLPFAAVPTVASLIAQTHDKTVKGYYARLALDRIARGQSIPSEITYPVQTWIFGDQLAMVNLAGEVVVDYALRLKKELDAKRLWINAYANDVPSYIASRRVIREGGYEAESSMYYYDKPSPLSEEAEDIIIKAVHDLLPQSFK
ncbi:MAG TPA: neutral/alkaline non-lysosomal ceramidase N-terminal domain-containing protein [Cyclobacteriaceae bacterium]|nr:neutral/alkaline non-lysosomal ceramidase N-terminal domain-containing protein [Cyclobacteriaceae bacterium]